MSTAKLPHNNTTIAIAIGPKLLDPELHHTMPVTHAYVHEHVYMGCLTHSI